MNTITS